MRRKVSSIAVVWLGLAALGLACAGGAGNLVGGGKKDKSGDAERDGGSSSTDDESTPATEPVEVSGSFLTADCDVAREDAPAPAEGEEIIGCMVIDQDSHLRTERKAKINSLAFVQADRSRVEARLLGSQAASPWHAYGRVPAGSMASAVAIVAEIEVDGTKGSTSNREPRTISTVPDDAVRALSRRITVNAFSGKGSEPYSQKVADQDPKTIAHPTENGTIQFTLDSAMRISDIVVTLEQGSEVELLVHRFLGSKELPDVCKVSTKKDLYRGRLWCEVSGEIDRIDVEYRLLGTKVGIRDILVNRALTE
jgi:hypothetical protein